MFRSSPSSLQRDFSRSFPAGRLALAALFFLAGAVPLVHAAADFEDTPEKRWEELEAQLPAYPREEDLVPFFVSSASDNRFLVDEKSIGVGSDGVVRYTLVVRSPAGASNVSFEGIRCSSAERRLYAFGRGDQTWSKARGKQWLRIENIGPNRQHAALFSDHFCPNGVIVRDAQEARAALRQGSHPATLHR